MNSGLIGGLCTLGGLIVVNIVIAAFSWGKLTQQVKELCRRVTRLERIINKEEASNGQE